MGEICTGADLMRSRGYTYDTLAAAVGLSPSWVCEILSGHCVRPSPKSIDRLSDALGVTVEDLKSLIPGPLTGARKKSEGIMPKKKFIHRGRGVYQWSQRDLDYRWLYNCGRICEAAADAERANNYNRKSMKHRGNLGERNYNHGES